MEANGGFSAPAGQACRYELPAGDHAGELGQALLGTSRLARQDQPPAARLLELLQVADPVADAVGMHQHVSEQVDGVHGAVPAAHRGCDIAVEGEAATGLIAAGLHDAAVQPVVRLTLNQCRANA